ncbi:mycofactocin-coupled SDR family oxidoreductase [uncultured Modestobacter sp.]|uniref:mycofactocin-coupled SDR family oxidoreductase n=1 Tax=uncultured Modestobacter sp. TaxID=380048 RepID=UPI002609CE81|nr:mycofactocin-coupled SDR family oxidoreductase [uncultured Modestobacter sp.]
MEGKVALVTGAARGQGRSHAVRLAEEGADVIAVDRCGQIGTVPYPMATPDDLAETVRQVEAADRRIVAAQADVRDGAAMKQVVDDGVARLGRLDVVVANAGVTSYARAEDLSDEMWDDVVGTCLSGVFRTARAAIPHLKADGGAMVLISSTEGLTANQHMAHYTAAKHGVVGLTKVLALELAPHRIRVTSVHPTSVDTGMIHNEATYELFRPDLAPGEISRDDVAGPFQGLNALPVPWMDPVDTTEAVAWLVSDAARYVTGIQLPVDAGATTT